MEQLMYEVNNKELFIYLSTIHRSGIGIRDDSQNEYWCFRAFKEYGRIGNRHKFKCTFPVIILKRR